LRNSSSCPLCKSVQTAFKGANHRWKNVLRVKVARAQIIVYLDYFLLAQIACVKSFVRPKPSRSRYWLASSVSPFYRRRASSVWQRRWMKNQCSHQWGVYFLLRQFLRQKRRNGNICEQCVLNGLVSEVVNKSFRQYIGWSFLTSEYFDFHCCPNI